MTSSTPTWSYARPNVAPKWDEGYGRWITPMPRGEPPLGQLWDPLAARWVASLVRGDDGSGSGARNLQLVPAQLAQPEHDPVWDARQGRWVNATPNTEKPHGHERKCVWNADGGFWAYARPLGRSPSGKRWCDRSAEFVWMIPSKGASNGKLWNETTGMWVDAPSDAAHKAVAGKSVAKKKTSDASAGAAKRRGAASGAVAARGRARKQKTFACEACGEAFTSYQARNAHVRWKKCASGASAGAAKRRGAPSGAVAARGLARGAKRPKRAAAAAALHAIGRGAALIGRRVRTDFGKHGKYCGRITAYDALHREKGFLKPYHVTYEDGEELWENLEDTSVELFSTATRVASSPSSDGASSSLSLASSPASASTLACPLCSRAFFRAASLGAHLYSCKKKRAAQQQAAEGDAEKGAAADVKSKAAPGGGAQKCSAVPQRSRVASADVHGDALINRRIRTDYGKDGFFLGTILRFDVARRVKGEVKPFFVRYDDGDEGWENLSDRTIQLLPADDDEEVRFLLFTFF